MASLIALRMRSKATLFIVSVSVIVSGISGWINYYPCEGLARGLHLKVIDVDSVG